MFSEFQGPCLIKLGRPALESWIYGRERDRGREENNIDTKAAFIVKENQRRPTGTDAVFTPFLWIAYAGQLEDPPPEVATLGPDPQYILHITNTSSNNANILTFWPESYLALEPCRDHRPSGAGRTEINGDVGKKKEPRLVCSMLHKASPIHASVYCVYDV